MLLVATSAMGCSFLILFLDMYCNIVLRSSDTFNKHGVSLQLAVCACDCMLLQSLHNLELQQEPSQLEGKNDFQCCS